MYISTHSMIDHMKRIHNDVDGVLVYLQVIQTLLARRGRRIFLPAYISAIPQEHLVCQKLLILLQMSHRYRTVKALRRLMYAIKKLDPSYTGRFTVVVPSSFSLDVDRITHILQQSMDRVDVQQSNQGPDVTGLHVHGEGLHYKRSLDHDLQVLLGR